MKDTDSYSVIPSRPNARRLAEMLGDHLIHERATCIHFPHPSYMVKVELLPIPTRGTSIYSTALVVDVQKGVVHVTTAKKRSRK